MGKPALILILTIWGLGSTAQEEKGPFQSRYSLEVNLFSLRTFPVSAEINYDKILWAVPLHSIGIRKQITANRYWQASISHRFHRIAEEPANWNSEGDYAEVGVNAGLRWVSGSSRINLLYGADIAVAGFQTKGNAGGGFVGSYYLFESTGWFVALSPALGFNFRLNPWMTMSLESAFSIGYIEDHLRRELLYGPPFTPEFEDIKGTGPYYNASPVNKLAIQILL